MTDHSAIARLASNLAMAERALLESGRVMTQFALTTPSQSFAIHTPWKNPEAKATYYKLLYLFCRAEGVTAVTLIAETWIRPVEKRIGETPAEVHARAHQLRASQAENRREAIIAGSCYRDQNGKIQLALDAREIIRSEDGWPIRTEPFSFEDGIPFDATIAHLLPPPVLPEDERQAARRELTLAQIASGIFLKPVVVA